MCQLSTIRHSSSLLTVAASTLAKFGIYSVATKTVFMASTIGVGFEFLHSHGNVGETVVLFNDGHQVPISPNARKPLRLDEMSTSVIAGGLGGLGQSLVRLLVGKGAKYIVFLSRSGSRSTDAHKLIQDLTAAKVVAKSYAYDILDEDALKDVLKRCSADMPPIRGVIQSAAVLRDSVYENMTHEMWEGAIRPKTRNQESLTVSFPRIWISLSC